MSQFERSRTSTQAVLSLPAAAPAARRRQRSGGMMAGLGGMMAQGNSDTTPNFFVTIPSHSAAPVAVLAAAAVFLQVASPRSPLQPCTPGRACAVLS